MKFKFVKLKVTIDMNLGMKSFLKIKYTSASFILLTLFFFVSCSVTDTNISLDARYPRWLKDSKVTPAQTSGITFLGNTGNADEYLIADDIGKIHRLFISSDTVFSFRTLEFLPAADSFLAGFPKKDFEEIFYDKYAGKVFLSIEGNGKNPKEFCGIYEIIFGGNDIHSNQIAELKPVNIDKSGSIYRFVRQNIGFEGAAVDEKYFYLGIETISDELITSVETEIYILDKTTSELKKTISTKEYGIRTICGLYITDGRLWGIDRNDRKIFFLDLGSDLSVKEVKKFNLDNVIPGYNKFKYVAAIESVTINDKNQMFIIDDPWTENYVPDEKVLESLDAETINNFRKFVPVIYRYNIKQ